MESIRKQTEPPWRPARQPGGIAADLVGEMHAMTRTPERAPATSAHRARSGSPHVLRERALRPDASLLNTFRARRRPGRSRPRRAAPRERRLRPKPTQRRASRHGLSMYTPLCCAAPAGELCGARATLTLRACCLMHAQARRTTKSVTINTDELSDDEEHTKVPDDTHTSQWRRRCA